MKKYIYTIYTDGGCAVNPGGPGGYGSILIHQDTGEKIEVSKGYRSTTNNRMEVMAVIAALEQIPDEKGPIELYSDSRYVIDTMNGRFSKKKNLDLWKRLDAAVKGKDITWNWIHGHNGNPYNERCDELCTIAMRTPTEEDTGYQKTKENGQEYYKNLETAQPKTGGAMAKSFSIPDTFTDRKIERLKPKNYSEKYQINSSCAKCIREFGKESKHTFTSYTKLKTGGIDFWSRKSKETIFQNQDHAEEIWEIISSNLEDEKQRMSCLRWYMRGLPLEDCQRKVIVDLEVQQNCF